MIVLHYIVAPANYVRLLVFPDRPPIAYLPSTRERIDFDQLQHCGVMISPPPGPLGLRPVRLGPDLIECWLPEEEWTFWKGAARVELIRWELTGRIEHEILKLEATADFQILLREVEPLAVGAKPQPMPE